MGFWHTFTQAPHGTSCFASSVIKSQAQIAMYRASERVVHLQFTEQSFPSLGGNAGDNGGEWEAWEDPDPPAPPPQKAAVPPPSQPAYRESKRPTPEQRTSDSVSSMYASGNRRMAPPQPAYAPAPAPVRPHAEPPRTNGSGSPLHACPVLSITSPGCLFPDIP